MFISSAQNIKPRAALGNKGDLQPIPLAESLLEGMRGFFCSTSPTFALCGYGIKVKDPQRERKNGAFLGDVFPGPC